MILEHVNCFLGDALAIDNGKIEVIVTLDVGPRIISLRPKNGFNMMFEDTMDTVNKDCSSCYGDGKMWHIYGGHRLWLSPESLWTYYPDNEKVEYFVQENAVEFLPKAWEKINVQPMLRVKFLPDGSICVEHKMTNLGEERPLCIWALTVLKSGGIMTLPLSKEDTNFLPNRNFVLWSYCSINDKRLVLGDDNIVVKSCVRETKPFKIGTYNDNINVSYQLEQDGQVQVFCKSAKGNNMQNYPDYFCNFECYCNDRIHEIETLSSIANVPTNGSIVHKEIWSIFSK